MLPALVLGCVVSLALWLNGLSDPRVQAAFTAAVALAAAWVAARGRRGADRSCMAGNARWVVPLAGLAALVAVQAANPSHRFAAGSHALLPLAHFPYLPRSVDRSATVQALMLLTGYASVAWLARAVLVDFRARTVFVGIQAAAGAAMAVWVILQRSVPPDGALYPATGAFVSANHYAAYASLLLPVTLLWALEILRRADGRGSQRGAGGLLLAAAAVLAVSVFRSDSRMGMVVAAIMLAAAAAGEIRRAIAPRRVRLVMAGMGMLLVAAGACWALSDSGTAMEVRRLARRVPEDIASRWTVWQAVAAMGADRWAAGTGAGTFAMAFPYYQPAGVPGFYRHAHNELLQGFAELGVFGMLLLTVTVYGLISGGAAGGRRLAERERWGLSLALGGLALHAMVDFPLRLPALALLTATWAGMSGGELLGTGAAPGGDGDPRTAKGTR